MSTNTFCVMLVALSLGPWTAATAYAQQQGRTTPGNTRPFRGIFGAPPSPDSPHSLILSGNLFAAYDDSEVDGLVNPQTGLPWVQRTGHYYGADAGLTYGFNVDKTRFAMQGQTGARVNYYDANGRSRVLPTYRADVGFTARLTSSLSLGVQQTAAYLSHYNSALAPQLGGGMGGGFGGGFGGGAGMGGGSGSGLGLFDDPSQDIFELKAVRSNSSVMLTNRFGRYLFASGAYHYRFFEVLDDSDVPTSRFFDYGSHMGSAAIMYARPMTRYATLQLGYDVKVTDGRSRTGEPQVLHTINAGVNYSRALSFSRRTTFSFGTGSAIAANERDPVPDGGNTRTQIRLTGNAALVHQIGQTWTAQLNYTRGFRTQDGFDDLFFTDAVNARFGGLVSRRLSFESLAAWTTSKVETRSGTHEGRSASVRLEYALTSFAALYTQYLYHHYRFSDDVQIDGRLPRRLDRQGARLGLTVSIPLIR